MSNVDVGILFAILAVIVIQLHSIDKKTASARGSGLKTEIAGV